MCSALTPLSSPSPGLELNMSLRARCKYGAKYKRGLMFLTLSY